jgi:hypothetical protein
MCYMGYFRSIEEAQAYTAARLNMEATTEEPTEEKTEAPTDDTTAAPEAGETTAAPEAGETTAAPDAGETTAAEKSGCGSVIGFSAVAILAAAAAAVALKKD